MKVIIVGAGIGGLTTALRLHHAGIDCEVFEQSSQIRELGVGVNVGPHAVKALAEVGLLPQLDQAGVRPRELIYTHRLGMPIMRQPCGLHAGYQVPQFLIHRGRLQQQLLHAVRERLGEHAIHTGHRLVGFDQDADIVTARFTDPHQNPTPPVQGTVLIGADGIHSAVRAQLFPQEGPPHWNGRTIWRGATDWPVFADGHTMMIAGGAAKLVIFPMAEGRAPGTALTNWVICVPTGHDGDPPPDRQDWSRCADPDDVRQHLDRFRTPLVDHAGLVAATPQVFVFPMCDRDPLPTWTYGRVTLLGDAAHPMHPMGGNGAGQAILDASCLAHHLAQLADDPTAALRAYQTQRLPATTNIVLRNREGGPERAIDIVEQRAPDGFTNLADVIDPAELDDLVASYARAAGAARDQVNSTTG